MSPAPPNGRRPRLSFGTRWGLSDHATYVAVPTRVLELATEHALAPAEVAVLVAVLHDWRAESGNIFSCSLARIAKLAPVTREYARRCLLRLNDAHFLGVFCEPGKTTTIDVTPLLVLVRKRPLTVAPGRQHPGAILNGQLSTPGRQASTPVDGTVYSGPGTVYSPSLRVDPQSQSNKQNSDAAPSASAGRPAADAASAKEDPEAKRARFLATLAAIEVDERTKAGGNAAEA